MSAMDPTPPPGAAAAARLGGGLDPFVNSTHYRVRGAGHSLCDLPISSDWEPPRANALVPAGVNCLQCHTNRHAWITDERILETMIEPVPVAHQRRVTSDDDPGRGRSARPPHLQVCLVRFRLPRHRAVLRQPLRL